MKNTQGWFVFWLTYVLVASLLDKRKEAKMEGITKGGSVKTKEIFQVLLSNFICSSFIPLMLDLYLDSDNPITNIISPTFIPSQLPEINILKSLNLFKFLLKIFFSLLVAEVWFYYTHLLLHTKTFYPYHRLHHRYTIPFSWATLYCSCFEMIFVNQLSVTIGPYLMNMNTLEICIWSVIVCTKVLLAHSGMLGSWDSKVHTLHHERYNVNFGVIYLLDRFHGTYLEPY